MGSTLVSVQNFDVVCYSFYIKVISCSRFDQTLRSLYLVKNAMVDPKLHGYENTIKTR